MGYSLLSIRLGIMVTYNNFKYFVNFNKLRSESLFVVHRLICIIFFFSFFFNIPLNRRDEHEVASRNHRKCERWFVRVENSIIKSTINKSILMQIWKIYHESSLSVEQKYIITSTEVCTSSCFGMFVNVITL